MKTRTSNAHIAGFTLLAAAAILLAGCSSSSTPAAAGGASTAGGAATTTISVTSGHLTDASGRTVYLWVADTGSSSTCTSTCATVWPPVTVTGQPAAGSGVTASDLSTTMRSDGSTQVLYAGHPLYYFTGDSAKGDAKGQGSDSFGAKWWELDGSGTAITGASSGGSTPSSSSSGSGGGYGY